MKTNALCLVLATAVICASAAPAQRKASPGRRVPSGLDAALREFFAAKHQQAMTLSRQANEPLDPDFEDFFKTGENGDWSALVESYPNSSLAASTVRECSGAFDQFTHGEEKYLKLFGQGILDSMPRGSIYFGGTDPGRWLPTAFSKSHAKADPVFVLTQNALADGGYLKYLRAMYGDRIAIPTEDDSKRAFDDYIAEAKVRFKEGKLKPGENVTDVNGKAQVSGQVAVMQINARLARWIFESNPDQEFFIEESFPLDWMYPHLAPNGFIMKIHRKPLTELPADVVRKDRDYWTDFLDRTMGKWLKPETSVEEVCDFVTRIFLDKELGDFQGDPKFARNDYACKTFSKLRSSIGGAYAWRIKNSASSKDGERMAQEADFAFRQAFVLCPYSPEALFRYINLLVDQKRKKDALLLAQTAQSMDPRNNSLANLISELERMK
jgi:hypothetical protein